MKKVLLVTVMTLLGLLNAQAQDISFGAKAGINFADITGDISDGPVTAFNLGLLAEIPVSEKFSFQPEIMYSGQGYGTGSGSDELVALSYLNVPLMGKYYVTKGLSVEAGPQIGFLLGADNEGTDVKSAFNSVDFGANLGLGYKLDNGLNFGLRYNIGLSDVSKIENVSAKNGVAQLSIGYFFF